jgi:oxygen-dependent protoporphyrinogen oxidase
MDAPVDALTHRDHTWEVASSGRLERFGAVILACPARTAATLLGPIDPEAAALCAGVRYVSTASVALAWTRAAIAHPLEGSGFVVARASTPVRLTACTWVSSKWDGRAPGGYALLRVYFGGAHDPGAVDMDDDEMVDVAVRELSAILSIEGPPHLARVYRWRQAGAQHDVGHRARVQQVEERLRQHPGLHVTGSGFRSVGVPDCIADGRAVAASLSSSRV